MQTAKGTSQQTESFRVQQRKSKLSLHCQQHHEINGSGSWKKKVILKDMGFCSRFALALIEMGPNRSFFAPQTRDVVNTAYTHIDTQSPHNGLETPTIFGSQCSQANSRQLQTKMKPGDFKASIRSSIKKPQLQFWQTNNSLKINFKKLNQF